MEKIKVGFIGYGYWGKNILRNLLAINNIEVAAVCDANLENLEKAKNVVTANTKYNAELMVTSQFDNLIANDAIDAIVIATPPQTHYKLGMQALNAGKHVFIEKPMTTNGQEAIDLVNAGILKQKQVMVGHTFLYSPVINDLKKLITSGELGDIHYMDFVMTNLGKYQKDNILWDLAPHGVSIVLYLLNNPEVVRVEANGISAIKTGLIDIAYLTLYFKNGSFANMHFSWLNPNKTRQLTVVGSKKMVVFDDINPLEKIRIYNKGISKDKSFSSWGDSLVGYRHGNIVSPVTSTGEPLKNELEHFADCILNHKVSVTNGSHGAKVVGIIEEAVEKLK